MSSKQAESTVTGALYSMINPVTQALTMPSPIPRIHQVQWYKLHVILLLNNLPYCIITSDTKI